MVARLLLLTPLIVAFASVPTRAESPPLESLLDSLGARIATGVHRDDIAAYRAELAAIDRGELSDDEWVDLHCALLAVDRRLDPAPRGATPTVDTSAFDAFDRRLRKAAAFPVGEERFDWLLRRTHGLPFDGAAIAAIGLDARQRARDDLAALAEEEGVSDWRELLERQRAGAPRDHDTLVRRVQADTAVVLELTDTTGLVTVPDVARTLRVDTAPRGFPYAYAAYFPGRLSKAGGYTGRYAVAPLPGRLDAQQRQEWLADFDSHFMRVVTAHEAYPGHHLQHAYAALVKSNVRRHGYNSVYIEGWGFYSERLIDEMGALDGPLDRLAVLRMRAWRAVRCYVDPALHSGRMRPSEAAELLVHESGMSRRAAEREIRMYLNRPTQALSYEIGRRMITRSREEFVALHGDGSLRSFHDRLLAFGAVPLPLARAALLGRRAAYDRLHP